MSPELVKQLIEKAHANRVLMDREAWKGVVDKADIVWGMWTDPSEPLGVGLHIIKGSRRLEADPTPEGLRSLAPDIKLDAVLCDSYEQAVVAEYTIGDGDLTILEKIGEGTGAGVT